jgi:phage-related protein
LPLKPVIFVTNSKSRPISFRKTGFIISFQAWWNLIQELIYTLSQSVHFVLKFNK